MELRLSPKQNEFICEANHRYNLKVGAVRSGKSYGDMAYVIPSRIRERHGKSGLTFIIGVILAKFCHLKKAAYRPEIKHQQQCREAIS